MPDNPYGCVFSYAPILRSFRLWNTDLKLENILVAFEDPAVIEKYVQTQVGDPMPRKLRNDRLLFISHNKFQHPENGNFPIHPKITDFSHARVEDGSDTPRIAPIQANAYRAPEVILGTGWSYSTDIWNFGVVVCTAPLFGTRHQFATFSND